MNAQSNLGAYMGTQNGLEAKEIQAMDNYMIGILSVYVTPDMWQKCTAEAERCLQESKAERKVYDAEVAFYAKQQPLESDEGQDAFTEGHRFDA